MAKSTKTKKPIKKAMKTVRKKPAVKQPIAMDHQIMPVAETKSENNTPAQPETQTPIQEAAPASGTAKNNTFAVLSLIFGIVFFIPLAPILAIIFGFVGLHKIKTSGEKGRGMAIAGIILGFIWLLLGIIMTLIFVLAMGTAIMSAEALTVAP